MTPRRRRRDGVTVSPPADSGNLGQSGDGTDAGGTANGTGAAPGRQHADAALGTRRSLAAVGGAVLCVVLISLLSSVWLYDAPGSPVWRSATLLERVTGPRFAAAGLLSLPGPLTAYELYGKAFFLVYLAAVPAVRSVRPSGSATGRTARAASLAWLGMDRALVVAAAADFVAYWGVSVPGTAGFLLWVVGLGVETLAVGVLLAATACYGALAPGAGVIRRRSGLLLVGAALAPVPTVWVLVGYLPGGLVVPLSVVWGVLGLRSLAA